MPGSGEIDEEHPAGPLRPMRPERMLDATLTVAAAAFALFRPHHAQRDGDLGYLVVFGVFVLVVALLGPGDTRLNDTVRWPPAASVEPSVVGRRRLLVRAVSWLLVLWLVLFVLEDRGAAAVALAAGAGVGLGQLVRLLAYERRHRVRLYRLPAPRWSLDWLRQRPRTVFARPAAGLAAHGGSTRSRHG